MDSIESSSPSRPLLTNWRTSKSCEILSQRVPKRDFCSPLRGDPFFRPLSFELMCFLVHFFPPFICLFFGGDLIFPLYFYSSLILLPRSGVVRQRLHCELVLSLLRDDYHHPNEIFEVLLPALPFISTPNVERNEAFFLRDLFFPPGRTEAL